MERSLLQVPQQMTWAEYFSTPHFTTNLLFAIFLFVFIIVVGLVIYLNLKDSIPASRMNSFLQAWFEQEKLKEIEEKKRQVMEELEKTQKEMREAREKFWAEQAEREARRKESANINININEQKNGG